MCRRHWALVSASLQTEVYRTAKVRGPDVDVTWAPWWRAAHRAIAAVAQLEYPGWDSKAWLDQQFAIANDLELKDGRKTII